MKIVTVEQMIELEQRSADAGAPPDFLMENAGLAIAEHSRDMLIEVAGKSIMVLVGPGNNGGDGLVAARHLHDWGAKAHLFLVKRKTENDKNFDLDVERKIPWTDALTEENTSIFNEVLSSADLFIDSLFGTGKIRPFEGVLKGLMESVAREKTVRPTIKVLAVDLPSGLDADTGSSDSAAISADLTVTFACPKIGLFQFPAAEYLGQLEIADIQIPKYLSDHINIELMTAELVNSLLPSRPLNANKGTFGKLLAIAGSTSYIGAACLACEGAMRVGTGLVALATPKNVHPIAAAKLTEITYIPLEETEQGTISAAAIDTIKGQTGNYDAMLLGCGLGQNDSTIELVERLIIDGLSGKPMVIDADGLNILSQIENWPEKLKKPAVLTPHPGEMSRLTGKTVSEIQDTRLETALSFAGKWNQTVVLKGAFTVIASPDGKARICGTANPGMASAGTGDVLAGTIAGFMAQGLSPFDASSCGVYVHAMAGELVKAEIGDTGMIASDLLLALPISIKETKDAF